MRPGEGPGAGGMDDEFALVPVYDVTVSAGHGATVDQEQIETQIAFRKDWLAQEGLQAGGLAAVRAVGDSMEPTIRPGALLLIDTTQRQIGIDDVYVLRLDDHLLAKRLQRLIDGSVRVSSDNKAYIDQTVRKEDVSRLDIIGKVIWVGQRP